MPRESESEEYGRAFDTGSTGCGICTDRCCLHRIFRLRHDVSADTFIVH